MSEAKREMTPEEWAAHLCAGWKITGLEGVEDRLVMTIRVAIDRGRQTERRRCSAIVNEARFEGSVDLRSIVSRIESPKLYGDNGKPTD